MNVLTDFFLFCSGSTKSILKRTPTEINKHIGLGATIFFTGLLAALSGGYAMYVVFENIIWSALFGLVWGLMIFNLDRFIVNSMRKRGGMGKQFAMAAPRLLLAALIALVIAVPLELRIFQKEIQKELVIIQNEELQQNRIVVDSLYSLETADLQSQINGYKQEIENLNQIYLQRQKELDYERLGTESDRTSGNPGYGPLAKEKEKQMQQADSERKQMITLLQPKIEELEVLLKSKMQEQDKKFKTDAASISAYNGIASQLQALKRLQKKEPIIGMAVLFVSLLILCLETAPIFVKLISPKGPYDDILRYYEVKSHYHYEGKTNDEQIDFEIGEVTRKNKLGYYLVDEKATRLST